MVICVCYRMQIRAALNQQTATQFRQYVQQQYPYNPQLVSVCVCVHVCVCLAHEHVCMYLYMCVSVDMWMDVLVGGFVLVTL